MHLTPILEFMKNFSTITNQRQITIPKRLMEKKGFSKKDKVNILEVENGLLIQKVPTIDDLYGSLHKYAIKNKSIEEIMEMEDKAIEESILEGYENGNN